MKRSKAVTVALVPLVAQWFAACSPAAQNPTHQQVCADQRNVVVDDARCLEPVRRGGAGTGVPYHYYYAPFRAGGYPLGASLSGGGTTAPAAASGARISIGRVVRGGFGTTGLGSVGA